MQQTNKCNNETNKVEVHRKRDNIQAKKNFENIYADLHAPTELHIALQRFHWTSVVHLKHKHNGATTHDGAHTRLPTCYCHVFE